MSLGLCSLALFLFRCQNCIPIELAYSLKTKTCTLVSFVLLYGRNIDWPLAEQKGVLYMLSYEQEIVNRIPQNAILGEDMDFLPEEAHSVALPPFFEEAFLSGIMALHVQFHELQEALVLCKQYGCRWKTSGHPVKVSDTLQLHPRDLFLVCDNKKRSLSWYHRNPKPYCASFHAIKININQGNDALSQSSHLKGNATGSQPSENGARLDLINGKDMFLNPLFVERESSELEMDDSKFEEFLGGKFALFVTPGCYFSVFSLFEARNIKWIRSNEAVNCFDTPFGNPEHIILSHQGGLTWQYFFPAEDSRQAIYPVILLQTAPHLRFLDETHNRCILDLFSNLTAFEFPRKSGDYQINAKNYRDLRAAVSEIGLSINQYRNEKLDIKLTYF